MITIKNRKKITWAHLILTLDSQITPTSYNYNTILQEVYLFKRKGRGNPQTCLKGWPRMGGKKGIIRNIRFYSG